MWTAIFKMLDSHIDFSRQEWMDCLTIVIVF